jgi:hypothetical protein
MRGRDAILGILIAAAIAGPGAAAAFAEEATAGPDKAVASEVAVPANEASVAPKDNREVVPATIVATPLPAPKPKAAAQVTPPPRPIAVAQQPSCSWFWCGRQVVLMLGIGY